ncbi:MAG: gamma-glutamyl-gamma-aminobutyrate hydrolase family protein [Candidatus Promineifilaceae bacterium]
MSNLPLIGITASEYTIKRTHYDVKLAGMTADYKNAVIEAGGIPVLIPLHIPVERLPKLLDRLDGLLVTGGGDVDPTRYGQVPGDVPLRDVRPERDEIELALTTDAIEREMPLLAICRGHQVLNVARGGTLYQDVASLVGETIGHDGGKAGWIRQYLAHSVEVTPDSHLAELLGTTEVAVNSFHHQSVMAVGDGLKVTAVAPDGVVEGMEMPGEKFVVSVQWHPENITGVVEEMKGLFKGLVDAA